MLDSLRYANEHPEEVNAYEEARLFTATPIGEVKAPPPLNPDGSLRS